MRQRAALAALAVAALSPAAARADTPPDPPREAQGPGALPRASTGGAEPAGAADLAAPGAAVQAADVPLPPPTVDARRAPRFALWVGLRPGVLVPAGHFYEYQVPGRPAELETTGNIAKPGPTVQVDLGARLFKRFIVYGFYERAFLTQGTLFAGTDVSLVSHFGGLGGRVVFGNPDRLGFVLDLAGGYRVLAASGSSGAWSMHSVEIFRFGLGAEWRLGDRLVFSPMFTVSTGTMAHAEGAIRYAPNKSVLEGPVYQNGASITLARTYLVAGLHWGAHFDLFGGG